MADDFVPETEEWRDIEGWPYEISTLARVRRTRGGQCTFAGRFLKASPGKKNYLRVTLADKGRRWSTPLHILVCIAFHGPRPSGKYDAAHWNGDNQDNRANNLRWATRLDNILDSVRLGRTARGLRNGHAKLSDEDVVEIRRLASEGVIARITAERFGVHEGTVHAIVQRRWRRHVPEAYGAAAASGTSCGNIATTPPAAKTPAAPTTSTAFAEQPD